MTRLERRWCRVLLDALLPGPNGLASRDLTGFWPRFDAAAPAHLRLGLRLATLLFTLGPLLLLRRPLPLQPPAARDTSLRRMARWPLLGDLVELAKVVGCFALFDDPAVQARLR